MFMGIFGLSAAFLPIAVPFRGHGCVTSANLRSLLSARIDHGSALGSLKLQGALDLQEQGTLMPSSASSEPRVLRTQCCIAGGGPAGLMLGYLLGRAGVETLLLEKHADFLRDFRGDTVHPSTMEIMRELGLLDDFLKRPHSRIHQIGADFGGVTMRLADFSRLGTTAKFIAMMPQWEFLDFLAEKAKAFPSLTFLRKTAVADLLRTGDRVTGVIANDDNGELRIEADLTVGCDGRHSTVRERAGLEVEDIGAPIDVLWFRVTQSGEKGPPVLAHAEADGFLITIDRDDYWQCAFVIAKGALENVKAKGLPAFRARMVHLSPELNAHIDDVQNWDDVKLLTVTIDRLKDWARPGVLCIGDAAHAMSPVGGVGINLAIQDAVATANLLAAKLQRGPVTLDDLRAVQKRREFPVRVIQAIQVQVQNRILSPVLKGGIVLPWPMKIVDAVPALQGIIARILGVGIRPEHVTAPQV